jgi:hypothetical protein
MVDVGEVGRDDLSAAGDEAPAPWESRMKDGLTERANG